MKPYGGSLNYLMSVCAINNNSTSTVDDVTALPENVSSYSHVLRLVSARSTRLESLRVSALSHGLCSRNFCSSTYPTTPTHIWYDYIYDFSKWTKFTEGRPVTNVFTRGRTYTYNKLPEFPKASQSKLKNTISRRKKTKAVT